MADEFLDLSGVHALGSHELLDARFPLLDGLSPILVRLLGSAAEELLVARGVELFRIGDSSSGLYLLDEGEVEVLRPGRKGIERAEVLGPKTVFGEFGVLRNVARTAIVRTLRPCRLIRIEGSAVHQALDADATFRERLESLLLARMQQNFFAAHPVFAEAPEAFREAFRAVVEPRFLHRGEEVFAQGEQARGVWFVLSGTATVRFRNRAGADVVIDLRRMPDVLGELAARDRLAYHADAAFDLDLWFLPRDRFRELAGADAHAAKRLEEFLVRRARRTATRIKEHLGVQP